MTGHLLRNELRLRFVTPTWWLLLAGSWLICGWLLFAQLQVYEQIQAQLVASGSNLGINDLLVSPTLNTLAALLLLVGPLLGMSSIAAERRSGRLPVLLSTPLPLGRLVLGKWLGIFMPTLLIAGVVVAMVGSLALGMQLAWGRLLSALLGLVLLGGLVSAFSLACSSFTRQATGAFAISLAGLGFLWLADSFFAPGSTAYWLALGPRLDHLLQGTLISDDLVYFLALTLLALGIAFMRLLRERESPPLRLLRELLTIGLLGACLAGTVVFSQSHRHTLYRAVPVPQALLETLGVLQGPVTITAYAPEYPLLRARIEKLVRPLQEHYPALELRWVDPQREPQLARELGITRNGELRIEGMGRSQRLDAPDYAGLLRAFRRIARHGEPWIVSIGGHGEAPIDRSPKGIAAWVDSLDEYGYRVVSLDPDMPIPDNAALLLVIAPQRAYPDSLRKRLADWLQHGGRLLWLYEGGPRETLAGLTGVQALPGTLVSAVRRTGMSPLQQSVPVPTTLGTTNAAALMDGAHSLLPPENDQWTVTATLSIEGRIWNETGPLQGEVRRDPLRGERSGPHTLGVLLQHNTARVAVLGDSDLARNRLFGRAGNRNLLLGLVNWLTGNRLDTGSTADDIEIHWSSDVAIALGFIHLLLGPLLAAGLGLWIQRRRGRR